MSNLSPNLPPSASSDSSEEVRSFFDKYFTHQITFPSNQIDAVLGFFLKNGFDEQAAKSTAIVLLNQARIDNVNPMQLIDTLKTLNGTQLSQVVTEILNLYREKTSSLGYKVLTTEETFESRNIAQ
jgi:hypothetical protein